MSEELAGVLDIENTAESSSKFIVRYNDVDFHVILRRVCVTPDTTELVFASNHPFALDSIAFSRLNALRISSGSKVLSVEPNDVIKLTFGRKVLKVKFKSSISDT